MLIIEFGFPAGRYHATPWGHNVNEGVVEWPPSPYRLARALMDLCKRRRPEWSDERLVKVLRTLESPIGFRLPPATASHTRSYLSSNTKDPTAKQKVFDAFVAVDRREQLLAAFDCEPEDTVRSDLDDLLSEMNYFGRSESWVKTRVHEVEEAGLNCLPAISSEQRAGMELVPVACLRMENEYEVLPEKPSQATTAKKGGKNAAPLSWLGALGMSTGTLLKEGWSEPPAQKTIAYLRRSNALRPRPRRRRRTLESRFTEARFALHSTVLPRVVDTVPFAERIHLKLMGIHKRVAGGDPTAVSPLFSGKDAEGKPLQGHEHAFILPLDEDGDGRIDHLLIKVNTPLEASELDAVDSLRSVWQPNGKPDVNLVLTGLLAGASQHPVDRWVSATPFVTKRHHRKGRGNYADWLADEIRRECEYHGLPSPRTVELTDRTQGGGHAYRWMEFVRSRKGSRSMRGHGCILEFDEPVSGPFAIGALAHFGLGLFVPADGK